MFSKNIDLTNFSASKCLMTEHCVFLSKMRRTLHLLNRKIVYMRRVFFEELDRSVCKIKLTLDRNMEGVPLEYFFQ